MTQRASTRRLRATALFAAAIAVASCDHPAPKEDSTLTNIQRETGCSALQTAHDTAETAGERDHMDAAFKRMRELGCFKTPRS